MNWKVTLAAAAIFFFGTIYVQKTNGEILANDGVQQLRNESAYRFEIWKISDDSPDASVVKRHRRAAERGYAPAQFSLALMYDSGQGVPRDRTKAAKWLRKAAEQEHVEAQYNLACMYDSGEGVPQDYAEAATWFRKAAEQGYASAQKNLGAKYGKGEGVPQSHAEAFVWSSMAALSGDKGAIDSRNFAASQLTPAELGNAQQRATKLFDEIQERQAEG